jgi:lipopolysaccharide biosynthesis glycosyltransferase
MIPIFIGYDPKESIAFHICVNSIIQNTKQPVNIIPLSSNLLNNYKEKHNDGSNEFIYNRFLVPHLMKFQGWAIFLDGDMIVKDDISNLWNYKDETKDIMVVKHDYKTKNNVKYLNNKNENYPRKNWSSVILWNCKKQSHKCLTPKFIENTKGSILHSFSWVKDNRIGSLPLEWNWLVEEYEENNKAKLLHYTLGTPSFIEYSNCSMASEWHKQKILMEYCEQRKI